MAIDYSQYGRYALPTLSGTLFQYRVPSQAFLLTATTGGHPTIINPSGSGRVFVPVKINVGFISGTTVIGSVLVAQTLNCGQGAATGAPILTATLVSAVPCYTGGPVGQSVMQWSPTTNTFTAAPSVICPTTFNMGAVAPTNGGLGQDEHVFEGTLAFFPGTAMSLVYSVTTSTALFFTTITGLEIPIPVQGTKGKKDDLFDWEALAEEDRKKRR